ncbi:hypothetical protein NCS52_00271900 [Fusarium sp. LHS14.1]|nr:hypothetical protein NCS52_00271900 [Fusarium sp. LHS14.1]
MSIHRLRATLDNPIVTPCPTPAVEASSSMISSRILSLQHPSPHWDDFRHDLGQCLRGLIRVYKKFEHAFDSPSNSWPSKGRGKLVATSSADPFLVAKAFTIATGAAHYCLDDFCIDQESLRPLQNTYRQTDPWLPLTPIWESNSLQSPFPRNPLLQTIRSYFNPSSSSSSYSLFRNFSQRASHWFYGLQVTENKYSTDALVHDRSDKYPKTSNHREVISDTAECIEVSTLCFQKEKAYNVVLNLDTSSQALNTSDQPGHSCSQCSSFVRQNRKDICIHGPCTTFEDANYVLQVVGLNGHGKTIRNCLRKLKGKLGSSNGEPEDNAGSIKRENGSSSRAPADGEASQKAPKRQRHHDQQSSHYDEGTSGPVQTIKKRKQESKETENVDWDEFDDANGKIKNSGKRKDEEGEKRKFACPFYKYDRQAFMSSRTCVGPGWDSVHRVKEHIFRRHMLTSTQCEKCLEQFETEPAFDEHVRNLCRKKPPSGSYGINKEQEKQLRSRKMYQKSLDEEEKWRAIYRIIFPGEKDIPSPYYDPEVPEIPDIYQQMLMQDLPKIVTRRLTAPESGLAEHISPNSMASRQSLTSPGGKKLNGGLDLMGSTQASVVEQHIQDAVKAAVKEMLSQVPGSKEANTKPQINVKGPEEELDEWMKKEEQVLVAKPTRRESNLLQPLGMAGTESKFDPQALYPTPRSRSSTFSRSPEVSLTAMAPQENGFYSHFPENKSGNILQEMPEGSLFPEFGGHISNTSADLGNHLAVPAFTSSGSEFTQLATEPVGLSNQPLSSSEKAELESYTLGPWGGFSQSLGSEFEPAFTFPDSNAFENFVFQEPAVEQFPIEETWNNDHQV